MSKGESRTPEMSQITATSEDSRMEVGRNRMDFIVGGTQDGYDLIWVI
jgi:hypothetical protein